MTALNSLNLIYDYEEFATQSDERLNLIEKLLATGTALSAIQDLGQLLTLILEKSREITYSDAGSVFLIDRSEEEPYLVFKVAQNDSLPKASFHEFAIPITPNSLSGYVAATGRSLNIPDAHKIPPHLPYQLDQGFDRDFGYRTCSVMVLPMQDPEGELIGVLQLINRKKAPDLVITPENAQEVTQPYSKWEERVIRSLASQAAISIERNILQKNIEDLFEGFVRASVQVIEARDPTTSGHSERVADLTVQLAREVNTIDLGNLRPLFFSERQLQEIRYAALLHDFGKVGVPESILNKRKKLYPEQLEVIRQRFAVAYRTLEMECADRKFRHLVNHPRVLHSPEATEGCSHCQALQQFDADLQRAIATLQRYQALIETMNEPEALVTKRFEALSEETLADLTALAQYQYRGVDGQLHPLLTDTELEQLFLPRGNLTRQERLMIESHVTHTYEFLRRIPWTKHLQEVPIIAYRHHETLDGSGYPEGLKGDEIPIQTQMLAVADIYDALTAADRPYKKPLDVQIALKILQEEAHKNKINSDLVEVFIQRQIYSLLGHQLISD